MNRLRLRPQIVVATFVPLVIFAIVSAVVAGYALVQVPRQLVLQRQTALTQVAAAGVAADLRGYVRLLESVAGELADNAGRLGRQQEILAERTGLLGRFTAGSALLDARGTAVAVTSGQEAAFGLNYAFRTYYREVQSTGQPAFSTVVRDDPGGYNTVVIAVPVLKNGDFAGVLLGEFALDRPEWANDLDLIRTPQGGRVFLADSNGTLIYHPDPGHIGTSIRGNTPLWALTQEPSAPTAILQTAQDRPVVASVAPIPGAGWWVVTEESWDTVLAPVAAYRLSAGGLLAFGVALAFVALLYSVRRVTRPLEALLIEGRRVASGQAFRPVAVGGPADVRDLLTVVNRMVARLDEASATLRTFALRVLQTQEEERLRLARDLHDETVQQLVGLAQRIELCADATGDSPPGNVRQQLQEIQVQAYSLAAEVRRMSNSLRPSILEDLGLWPAIQIIARDLERQLPRTKIQCEVVGREARLPAELELTVFRIAQEALNNIRKHATSATRVNIALIFDDVWGVALMVEDDGPGFEALDAASQVCSGQLGLMGMAERAQLFGGSLSIVSAPGEGATVSLYLPRPTVKGQAEMPRTPIHPHANPVSPAP